MTQTQQEIAVEEFCLGWILLKGKKFDSPENRLKIIERVTSYRIHPSETAVVRAISELIDEGEVARTDGKTAEDDQRESAKVAEDRDRQLALSTSLTQIDAALYASMSQAEIAQKCSSDNVFRFRYEAASRLWGFRLPSAPSASEVLSEITPDDGGPAVPMTAEEYRRIPTQTVIRRHRNEPRFRAAIQKLIDEGKI